MRKTPAPGTTLPSAKPLVALVGAGNLAGTLASALLDAGYEIEQIVTREGASSLRRARVLADKLGVSAFSCKRTKIGAKLIWFCVPDAAIADAAESLAEACDWKGKVALHSSGALTSDELAGLRKRGAVVASVHPLMTFVRGSSPRLDGVSFAIEGDRKAVRVARAVVGGLGGRTFAIRKRDKAAYHAWGMFLSPLLTALLAASENVAAGAGIGRSAARVRMLPIVRQTIANYAELGARRGLSGPMVRGDARTVKKHLEVLQGVAGAAEIYRALSRSALRDLPVKNRTELEKLLEII